MFISLFQAATAGPGWMSSVDQLDVQQAADDPLHSIADVNDTC